MLRVLNIAKQITLLAILLVVGASYAHAQNSSANPYIDSWHKYNVPMGNAANTVVWEIREGAGAPITLTNGLQQSGETWIALGKEPAGTPIHAYIEIKFIDFHFDDGDTWTLTYYEHDITSGLCIAVRSLDINPVANDFFLAAGPDGEECNSWSDKVWPNTIDIGSQQDGTVEFTVNINKAEAHRITVWSFAGTIVSAGTGYSAPASLFTTLAGNTDNNLGTYVIEWTSGTGFTLTVTVNNPSTENYTSDAVSFLANIYGPAIDEVAVTLTITGGQAVSGENYNVITDDNGSGDNNQVKTLLAIPATSVIVQSD